MCFCLTTKQCEALCVFVQTSTPQAAIESLDAFYGGKILGVDKEDNARTEAYALKSMLLAVHVKAKHFVNGSRLPTHIRNLVQNVLRSGVVLVLVLF